MLVDMRLVLLGDARFARFLAWMREIIIRVNKSCAVDNSGRARCSDTLSSVHAYDQIETLVGQATPALSIQCIRFVLTACPHTCPLSRIWRLSGKF